MPESTRQLFHLSMIILISSTGDKSILVFNGYLDKVSPECEIKIEILYKIPNQKSMVKLREFTFLKIEDTNLNFSVIMVCIYSAGWYKIYIFESLCG